MTCSKRASVLVAALFLGAFALLVVGEFEFIGVLAPLPPPGVTLDQGDNGRQISVPVGYWVRAQLPRPWDFVDEGSDFRQGSSDVFVLQPWDSWTSDCEQGPKCEIVVYKAIRAGWASILARQPPYGDGHYGRAYRVTVVVTSSQ